MTILYCQLPYALALNRIGSNLGIKDLLRLLRAFPNSGTGAVTSPRAGGSSILAGARSILAGARSILAGARSILAGGRSILAGGRSILAGGRSILAGGHSILAGAHSILAGARSILAGAHSILAVDFTRRAVIFKQKKNLTIFFTPSLPNEQQVKFVETNSIHRYDRRHFLSGFIICFHAVEIYF